MARCECQTTNDVHDICNFVQVFTPAGKRLISFPYANDSKETGTFTCSGHERFIIKFQICTKKSLASKLTFGHLILYLGEGEQS
jgi:hypothetical protein